MLKKIVHACTYTIIPQIIKTQFDQKYIKYYSLTFVNEIKQKTIFRANFFLISIDKSNTNVFVYYI